MAVRQGTEQDLDQLVGLYKSFFVVHNRFRQSSEEIKAYLKEQMAQNQLFVSEFEGQIKAAMLLVNFGSSVDGTHKLWKYRHFAWEHEENFRELLEYAENVIRQSSKTAKVELTLAENEPGIHMYSAHSYEQEAALRNHYRPGETCFIMSKDFA